MAEEFETFRDPLLSLFQSVVGEVGEKIDNSSPGHVRRSISRSTGRVLKQHAVEIAKRETSQTSLQPAMTTRDLSKSGVAKFCAELALRYIKALAVDNRAALDEIESEYVGSTCDSAWVSTLKEYTAYFGITGNRAHIPYVRASQVGPKIIPMKPDAKVALVADWGTGAQPALNVLSAIAARKPDVMIHLGDIYYSGTPKECQDNFVEPVQRILRKDTDVPVYTLSGNHDMYCGGLGYYSLVRTLNPPPLDQQASFFCLRSTDEKWQFLAMDTGLHDHSPYGVTNAVTYLEDDELAWHVDRMAEFKGRTILLSHHQLFSAFSGIGQPDTGKRNPVNPQLLKAFDALRAKGDISAWYWGHEHSLSIYQKYVDLERGRCIGHGAIPVPTADDIYGPLDGLDNAPAVVDRTRLGVGGGVWNHGYATLSLTGTRCEENFYELAPSGERSIWSSTF
ncbi:metallophosphoesterase [Rhizobium laguerreae]|uniref:metallophosphoesterase family protein n=1 Tax=Rhizobium laguerreae TaxID=1076926 RepID=UPI001C903885|nr:metallophosphoesterase [Rhizobium laguerreae]MBY3323817.1 metallophosphoesterase [Rhizobium laguerreae]